MDVVVIGGGVVGLSVAASLQRRGADVTVLEAGEWGRGASEGNAGWISPGLANPVPAPGVMGQALRWMPNPRSPLLVRPTPRLSFLRWSWQFWRSTKSNRYGAGMAALAGLGTRVLDDYDQLVADGVEMEMHSEGLLFVGRSAKAVRAEVAVLREAQSLGYRGRIEEMTGSEVREHEPALGPAVTAGVWAKDERHVRPESVTGGIVKHLEGRADLRAGVAARRITPVGDGWQIETDQGEVLRTPRVVVATGWQSADLLAPLGVHLPMEGGKGYSVTVADPAVAPMGTLYLLEDRVAVSSFDGALRLAGTMELGTASGKVNPGRVAAIEAAAKRALVAWDGRTATRWAGFRPMLPDGVPAIGPVPGRPGLHVATGHAMLGVTLGPTTGEILAPAVLGRRASAELAPFSLARFGNRSAPAVPTANASDAPIAGSPA
jgi:D-amino-acid dehydrogenase